MATLVAACGSDGDGGGAAAGATDAPTTTAAAREPTTTTAAPEPRDVVHAMGTTEVPGDPQRVVALDSSFVDAAVVDDREWMLGIGLIGAGIIHDDIEALLA